VELKPGDCVRTEAGEIGKIVFIDRLTVFVSFPVTGTIADIRAFLKSTLTLANVPSEDCDKPDEPQGEA
jgi:hypothetical protein